MEKWLRYLALYVFLVDAIFDGVSAQPNNCIEFKVIAPDQYDRQSSSSDDITKRPLGYSFAISYFPGVQSNPENPCVYLNNLTSNSVEVMDLQADGQGIQEVNKGEPVAAVQTRVHGESVCVKDSSPQPNIVCNAGAFVAGCWEATADTMSYEFYCDPGEGCNSNVQFWYRLTPSTGDDTDSWCLSRSSDDFPNTLAMQSAVPPPLKTTVKSHRAPHLPFSSVVVFNLLVYACVVYL